jgi:hypothetical protein
MIPAPKVARHRQPQAARQPLSAEEMASQVAATRAATKKFKEELEKMERDRTNHEKILTLLGIPFSSGFDQTIRGSDLLKILMDDTKLKVLVSKLNNKAFW